MDGGYDEGKGFYLRSVLTSFNDILALRLTELPRSGRPVLRGKSNPPSATMTAILTRPGAGKAQDIRISGLEQSCLHARRDAPIGHSYSTSAHAMTASTGPLQQCQSRQCHLDDQPYAAVSAILRLTGGLKMLMSSPSPFHTSLRGKCGRRRAAGSMLSALYPILFKLTSDCFL